MKRILLAYCVVFWATTPVMPVHGSQRTALVIGNGDYKSAPLKNPVNDARDMAARLRSLGFDVLHGENVTRKQMRRLIRQFEGKIKGGNVGLFYYAGHGMQVDGRNYLIPIKADINKEYEVPDEGVDASTVLRAMQSAGNKLNIVILDACRNNPFARNFRSGSRGLARMHAPSGSIVAYATAPGSVAADGDGRNGIYTKHLLAAMNRPGLTIERLFKQVRIGVKRETGKKQIPWEESSLDGEFYFIPGKPSPADNQPSPQPAPIVVAGGPDIARWLKECDAHFKANRITSGAGGNALTCYRDVLAQDKGNSRALDGLDKIEKRYLDWTQTAIKKQNKAKAERNLKKLKQVNPEHTEIDNLTARITKLSLPEPPMEPTPILTAGTQAASTAPPSHWKPGTVFRDRLKDGSKGPEVVMIPAGTFLMGKSEAAYIFPAYAGHNVTIGKRFALGKYEVTFDEYDQFSSATNRKKLRDHGWGRGRHPVVKIKWKDAAAYVRWLSEQTGKPYRLPSESEWEYAARGGTTTKFWWGDKDNPNYMNYGKGVPGFFPMPFTGGKDQWVRTAPVGSFPANPFGLHDTSGNVWELVADCWQHGFEGAPTDGSPRWDEDCGPRTIRGGSWGYGPFLVQSISRAEMSLQVKMFLFTGFRVARDLTPEERQ